MNVSRVTLLGSAASSVANIDYAASEQANLQQQLSSGQRISTASDDPSGTVAAMGLKGQLARTNQYASSAGDALARLATADTAYTSAVSQLQSAQTLVLQASNTGTNNQTSLNAIATNLDGIRSNLLSLANTTYNGQPVFGGTTTGPVAYDSDGNYVGDSGTLQRQVASNVTVSASATGPDVFGSGDTSVFALLSSVSASLKAGTGVPSGTLDALTSALSTISTAQSAEGATSSQVQQMQTTLTSTSTALTTRLSQIQDADYATTAIQLASANTAYQASIQTAAMVNRTSLLDYLN